VQISYTTTCLKICEKKALRIFLLWFFFAIFFLATIQQYVLVGRDGEEKRFRTSTREHQDIEPVTSLTHNFINEISGFESGILH
jgi:hypothetical protein